MLQVAEDGPGRRRNFINPMRRAPTPQHKRDIKVAKAALGDALANLRREANLTQVELGEMVGISGGWVSKVEGGKALTPDLYKPYADALQMSYYDFCLLLLRYEMPFIYAGLFGVEGDEDLEKLVGEDIASLKRRRKARD